MARDYERVSLRIYEDEIPDLFRQLRKLPIKRKSQYLRHLLLKDEFMRAYAGRVSYPQVPVLSPNMNGNNDMPVECEKLLFDDEIDL